MKERLEAIAIYLLPTVYGLIPSAMLGVFVFGFFKAPFQMTVIAAGSITFLLLALLVLLFSHALAKQQGDVERMKTYMKGVAEQNIIGVEAPLWSETVRNITAAEFLAMPRLPAIAEVGWTPQSMRSWESFRERIAAQAPRWNLMGVNYYRSPQVDW